MPYEVESIHLQELGRLAAGDRRPSVQLEHDQLERRALQRLVRFPQEPDHVLVQVEVNGAHPDILSHGGLVGSEPIANATR